jgi:ATP-dependent RNA helicase SUPV3L1/SUV3
LEEVDLPIVQRAMQIEAKPIKSVAIQPPDFVIIRFSQYFPPETPFSYILLRLYEMSQIHPRFQLCDLTHTIGMADIIEPIRNLSIADRISICAGPAVGRDEQSSAVTFALAKCIADQSGGGLLDIPEIPIETLDLPITIDKEYLQKLETLHKSLVLYLWLSYRFTGVFISQDMAFHVKRMVEERMDKVLTEQSKKRDTRTLMKKLREQAMLQSLREQWQHYKIGEDGLVPRTPNVVDDGGSVLAHTFGGGNIRSIEQNVHI